MKLILLLTLLITTTLQAETFKLEVFSLPENNLERQFEGTQVELVGILDKIESKLSNFGFKPSRFVQEPTVVELNDHANVQCWDRVGLVIAERPCTTREVVIQEAVEAHQVDELDIDGNPTGVKVDVPPVPEVKAIEYELPATYKLVVTDITAEVEAEKLKEEEKKAKKEDASLTLRAMIEAYKKDDEAKAIMLKLIELHEL